MLLHNVKERKRIRFVASYLTSNLKKTLRIMLYAHCRAEIDWVLGQKGGSRSCIGNYYVLNTYYVLYFTYNTLHTHTGLNKARYSYTQLYSAIQG